MVSSLTVNGKQYSIAWEWLPTNSSGGYVWTPSTSGNLVVSGGTWAGTYNNTPVMIDSSGYAWAWPNEEFSVRTTVPVIGSTGGSGSPPGPIAGLQNLSKVQQILIATTVGGAIVIGSVVAILRHRHKTTVYGRGV